MVYISRQLTIDHWIMGHMGRHNLTGQMSYDLTNDHQQGLRFQRTHKAVVGGPTGPAMAWPLFLPRIFFTILCY